MICGAHNVAFYGDLLNKKILYELLEAEQGRRSIGMGSVNFIWAIKVKA
jgi:hypothetical protein